MDGLRVGPVGADVHPRLTDELQRRGAAIAPDPAVDATRGRREAAVVEATEPLLAAEPAWVAVGTGRAVRAWARLVRRHGDGERLRAVLDRAEVAVRQAGAVADLQSLGVVPAFLAPRETDAEVAAWIAARAVAGDTVGLVSDPGGRPPPFERLERTGLRVLTVTPHPDRPSLPSLSGVVDAATAGRLDAVVVAAPAAARRLVETADRRGRAAGLREAARGPVGALAMGPATAAALEAAGIPVAAMPLRARPDALADALARWAADRASGGLPAHRDRRWPIALEPATRTARVAGRSVELGAVGFGVLGALVRRPWVTCHHALLLREAWDDGVPDGPAPIKHHIYRIRERLGPAGCTITTVHGIGYRYDPQRRTPAPPVRPGSARR